MAEPFGIAASAFQVAGAGIALANTLKAYTDSVRKAEKQLKPIADHIKLTADVLTNVGSLLKNDDIRSLYTKELLSSTSNALGGCRTAFEDLEKFISKLLKSNENTGGRISIQASAKFTLYFKQKELDVLQAHLERFKSSLDLVLGVLNLASSARSAKDTSAIAGMKADIQRLIQAEHDAKKKETNLVLTTVESNASTESANNSTSRELSIESPIARSLPAVSLMNAMAVAGAAQRSTNLHANQHSTRSGPIPHPTPGETVLQYLSKCADAAAQLTADIEKAVAKWNYSAEYEPECLTDAYQSTATAMHALTRYEQKVLKAKEPPPPYIQQNPGQAAKSWSQITAPLTLLDPDEDYRRRIEQIKLDLDSSSDEKNAEANLERERRKREHEQRAHFLMSEATDTVQYINSSMSDMRENRIRIVDPPNDEEALKPKGILKKPTEKFPERVNSMREDVAPLKDVADNASVAAAGPTGAALGGTYERSRERSHGYASDTEALSPCARSNDVALNATPEKQQFAQPQNTTETFVGPAANPFASHDPAVPPSGPRAGEGIGRGEYGEPRGRGEFHGGSREGRGGYTQPALSMEDFLPLPKPHSQGGDTRNAGSITPPEISIDYAPPSRKSNNVNDSEAMSPPVKNEYHNSDSDQRDYILNLAEPEHSPSNGAKDGRVQNHPAAFQCSLCPKRFTRAYNLRAHLRTHIPFACAICGKGFARQHDRKRHERLHSDGNGEPQRTSLVNSNSEYYDSTHMDASDDLRPRSTLDAIEQRSADLYGGNILVQGKERRPSRTTSLADPMMVRLNPEADEDNRRRGRRELNMALKKEYTMVEKGAVELNALAGEIYMVPPDLSDSEDSIGLQQNPSTPRRKTDKMYARAWDAPDSWAVEKSDTHNGNVEEVDGPGQTDQQLPIDVDELLRNWTTLEI